jgi:glycosyltransferase involved in cell wall biosynthesis
VIPLISIIIPTFNSGKVLSNCLESCKSQTFNNFEIIIVDGVSIDDTLKIISSFKSKFKDFQFISENDKGIYDAMNKGILMAKGDWIYFMGSDDTFINKEVLNTVFKNLASNIDVVYGNVLSEFYGGIYDGAFDGHKIVRKNICHQSIFFNISVFKKTGYFDLNYPVVADWDHNIKWFFNSRIKHQYIDVLVANFSDNGFSAQHEDLAFLKVKNFKLLKLGFYKLPFHELKRLCRLELNILKTNFNILTYVYLQGYMLLIRFRRKMNYLKGH